MIEIELILPFPPTLNSYYGQNKHTRYLSRKGREFGEAVALAVHEQGLHGISLLDPLHVEVTLFPPDRRDRDLDNYMKGLLDSLTRSDVWEDDKLVDQLSIFRGRLVKGGLCIVRINEAGPLIPAPSFAKG